MTLPKAELLQTKEGLMGKKIFLEIVVLIVINGFVQTFFKCLHAKYCAMCKK